MENSINIVGCGGFGVKMLNRLKKQPINGAPYNAYYIDTSKSDLELDQDMSFVSLIPGCDGSGKNPQLNYDRIVKAMPNVVTKFKPAEKNVLVFSLSGGSGNTIAMTYLEACWREGKEAIMFAIGSREDLQALTNIRNMLANFRATAVECNKVAIMYYDDNMQSTQSDEVDRDMITALASWLTLNTGNHTRLDSRDIIAWMNPKVESQILLLDITADYQTAKESVAPVAIATLYASEESRTPDIPALLNFHGVRKLPVDHNLYFVLSADGLNRIIDSVNSDRTDYRTAAANMSNGNEALAKVKTDNSGRAWGDD